MRYNIFNFNIHTIRSGNHLVGPLSSLSGLLLFRQELFGPHLHNLFMVPTFFRNEPMFDVFEISVSLTNLLFDVISFVRFLVGDVFLNVLLQLLCFWWQSVLVNLLEFVVLGIGVHGVDLHFEKLVEFLGMDRSFFGPHGCLPISLLFALVLGLLVLLFFLFLWSWGSIVFALALLLLREEVVCSLFN